MARHGLGLPKTLEPHVDPFTAMARSPPRLAKFSPGTPHREQIAWSNWMIRVLPRLVNFVQEVGPKLLPHQNLSMLPLFHDIAQRYKDFTVDITTVKFRDPVPVYPGDYLRNSEPVHVHVQLPGVRVGAAHVTVPDRNTAPAPAGRIGLISVRAHDAPILLPPLSHVLTTITAYGGPRFFEGYYDDSGYYDNSGLIHLTTAWQHAEEWTNKFEHGLLSGESRRPYTLQYGQDLWEAQNPLGTSPTQWLVKFHDSPILLSITLVAPYPDAR